MKWRTWVSAFAVSSDFALSSAQTSTTSIGLTYCAPPATASSPQSTIGPYAPYYLFVAEGRNGPFKYLNEQGYLTNITEAAQFIFTDDGQLRVGERYVSTDENTTKQPFSTSATLGSISTAFTPESGLLRWRNAAFVGIEASFCRTDDAVTVTFNGSLPDGCRPVLIGVVLVSSFFDPGTSTSTSSSSSLSPSTTTSASSSGDSSGVASTSSVDTTATTITTTASLSSSSLSSSTMSSSASDADNTSSSAITTTRLDTSSSSNSILSITPISTPSSQYTTTTTSSGMSNPDSTSILGTSTSTSTSANAPTQEGTEALGTSGTATTSNQPIQATTVNGSVTTSTQAATPTSTMDTGTTTSLTTTTTTTAAATAATTTTISSNAVSTTTMISSTIEDLTTRTIPPSSTDSTVSATTTATTSVSAPSSACSTLPLASSICPSQDRTTISLSGNSPCYGILCSKSLVGTVLTANSTVANSLRACAGYCSLYNTAIPYGCLGVNYLGATVPLGQNNCLLYTAISEEDDTAGGGVNSVRLIYSGYPNVQKRQLMVSAW